MPDRDDETGAHVAHVVPVVDGELIVDESGFGLMPPEFARGPGGTWISLRPLGVPLPIDVTPRSPQDDRDGDE
jgi:hypothetical protein